MQLLVLGLSHKTAPVSVREEIAMATEEVETLLCAMVADERVVESLVLSTCNRVEIYALASVPDGQGFEAIAKIVAQVHGLDIDPFEAHGYRLSGDDALRHLLRVTASLDSMVVGEPQILGQVKDAARIARESGALSGTLDRLVDRVIHAAKVIRTETGIARMVVSIGSVAVELARRIFSDISTSRVLLIGAGEMAEVTAQCLASAGVQELSVMNRSVERAQMLASQYGWSARDLDELHQMLVEVDVVLTSTSAREPIITVDGLKEVIRERKYRPLFMVDIAVPRNVCPEVSTLDTVYLYNVDDLESICRDNMAKRAREAIIAEQVVDRELDGVYRWLESLKAAPTLRAIRSRAEQVGNDETERTLARRLAHLSDEDKEQVRRTVASVVAKILHPTMESLRDPGMGHLGGGLVAAARQLHGVASSDDDDVPPKDDAVSESSAKSMTARTET